MISPRLRLVLCILILIPVLGCTVQSRHKTRSSLSEEELEEIVTLYTGSPEEEDEWEYEPFLDGIIAPAISVNGLLIEASDIQELYMYLADSRRGDALAMKQEACMEWIGIYAVMSQWPDTIEPARRRLDEIRMQADQGANFAGLVVENSQEPNVLETGGSVGPFERGEQMLNFEMHAFTDPVFQVRGPFPTILGWHLIEPQNVNRRDDPDNPKATARHLLLFHGLDPENARSIEENAVRWTNLATVELLLPELTEVLPRYARPEPPQ